MKYRPEVDTPRHVVAPCEGAWIEIGQYVIDTIPCAVAPCEGAWIEMR